VNAPEILLAAAQIAFAAVGAWLTHIDIREHRLPNRIVLPAALVLAALAIAASAADGSADAALRAGAGAALLGGFYLVLRAASGGGLGGGDVKLAVPTGLVLAWDGWHAFVAGGALAFAIGGTWALGLIALRRGSRQTHIAFGPCIVTGALVGMGLA